MYKPRYKYPQKWIGLHKNSFSWYYIREMETQRVQEFVSKDKIFTVQICPVCLQSFYLWHSDHIIKDQNRCHCHCPSGINCIHSSSINHVNNINIVDSPITVGPWLSSTIKGEQDHFQ